MRILKAFNLVVCLSLLYISTYSQTTAQSTAYQINPTHTGAIQDVGATPPLRKRWSINLGADISYPLIANGKVFVTVRNASNYGTKLYAIDATTGTVAWGPIELGGTYYWSGICYENERVFAINGDGLLRAFNANNGSLIWSIKLPNQYSFSTPPVAYKGVIYTDGSGSGGTLYAVSAQSGAVLWTKPVANGSHSSPAVTDEGIYVSYSCPNVYKFNPIDGMLLWRYSNGCSGGGGKTPVLYNGRLYVRDSSDYIFDSETGTYLGTFDSRTTPAFSGNMGFFLSADNYLYSNGTLQGMDLNSNTIVWSFAGDGYLRSAPIVMDNYVYVGSNTGMLYALDPQTGSEVWSTNVGASIPHVDEHNVSQPLTGFGAGEGILVIPAGSVLIAYDGDRTPPTLTWGTLDPTPNTRGWNNSPVSIAYKTDDDYSGVASSTPGSPVSFSSEGINQTQTVTVTDKAGNSADFVSPAVNIDLTKPVTTSLINGASSNGWYRTPVTISLSATDNLSGIAASYYSIDGSPAEFYVEPLVISSNGSHSISYWSVDNADNVEIQKSLTINIDNTVPTVTAKATPSQSRATKKPVLITVSGLVTDNLSGINAGSVSYQVIDEYGLVQPTGSIVLKSDGTYSFTVSLMASRNRNDVDGRIYKIIVRASDQAGNIGEATTIVKIL
jgi:outer membrane protein assembly factor BamB